jgi:ATP-dependent helicase Lhr and Lhr-like helicase
VKSLDLFHPYTANWFQKTLGSPTPVQEEAWPSIAEGNHTLVSAPTGTGKTLSAFLVFIDRLKAQAREGLLQQELQLIYVSPLKSLAGDIRENLKRPLEGIYEEELASGAFGDDGPPVLSVGIRTGDTTQSERRQMIKKPPHILITTPESLYLMLTSKTGQSILRTAKAIILDELHAMIDSKRGAHLMLSIARLDKLCEEPLQRIGLSATIEPLTTAADYLSPDPVRIVAPRMKKDILIAITSPIPDNRSGIKDSVWQEIARAVYEHCKSSRSIIAFVEGRAYAEKLAYYVNLLAGEGFARTHHGSLSKEQRFEVEHALRSGTLRMLCATSSMELGIDVGDIDQVFQIGCPRSISSTMQRLGRAGHNPNRTSVMHIFPRTPSEGLYSGLTAEVARNGGVEYSNPPRLCLDVLAQHLVSMAAGDGYELDEIMELLPRAYPFREVTREDVKDVLSMLAGDYEHDRNIPVRPRILYDRINERVEGDPYSRMLAVSAGGTIPDRGLYTVKTETGVKLGELDEEFVFESRIGDRFLLGTFAWQITKIQKDTVLVAQTNSFGARLPFWKGDIKGRSLQTGIAFGTILRRLSIASEIGFLNQELSELGLDVDAAAAGEDFIKRQLEATGILPDDRTILIEHFRDETGNQQMMVHSVFGKKINSPLAILTLEAAKRHIHANIGYVEDDDGFLLFPYGEATIPEGLLLELRPEDARKILEAILPITPLFNMNFRYNTAHALMMGVRKAGRVPLWVQRMRSAEMLDSLIRYDRHPLIRETKRECLEDYWDLSGLEYVLQGIRSGLIRICELYVDTPSPMSFLLRQQTEAANMYDYSPTPMGIHNAVEEARKEAQQITPEPEHLLRVAERKRLPEDEKQLHTLLMIEGDIVAGELDIPIEWLELLARRGQASYIEPGLWIASEHLERYKSALIESDTAVSKQLVLRVLRYRGPQTSDTISDRYFWKQELSHGLLKELCKQGDAVEQDGLFYHAELYDRARKETIRSRRAQIRTLPSESYAALLASRIYQAAGPTEQLAALLKLYSDQTYPTAYWESVLLPSRVTRYRPELLDSLLGEGNYYWQLKAEEGLSFHRYEDIDWEADISDEVQALPEPEQTIYDALYRRGASFMQRLNGLIPGETPYDTLLSLAEKGLVRADSFLPVRQWLNKEKLNKATVKQRVSARAKAMSAGRWEITHARKPLTLEEQLERCFDRVVILSRETADGISWGQALETLRVWEYTGRVRRGYFVEGLSGVQFIRDKDFIAVIAALEKPGEEIIWLSAVDPAQQWGKSLPHPEGRAFINIMGTVVALRAGMPIAVMERQGRLLRVFDWEYLEEALRSFALEFTRHRIYASQNRLLVKEYPPEAATALSAAGFKRELGDYALYRL